MISNPKKYLVVLVPVFVISALLIIINQRSWINIPLILFGLALGSLIPDIDHLIFWLYRSPGLSESQQAQNFWHSRQYQQLLSLLKTNTSSHDNLIFHHFFGHSIITILSFFIFSSTSGAFTQSLILALNLHLFLDVYHDWRQRPTHLQAWLFAREPKQLSLDNLKYYVVIFFAFNLFYLGLFLFNL